MTATHNRLRLLAALALVLSQLPGVATSAREPAAGDKTLRVFIFAGRSNRVDVDSNVIGTIGVKLTYNFK